MSSAPTVHPAASAPLPLRYLDVVLVFALAPLVLLAGAPILGYAVGAVVWTLQRVIGERLAERARRSGDPRAAAGLPVVGVMARAWLTGGAIVAVGLLADRDDGLAAALLLLGAFTVYFAVSIMLRPRKAVA